MSTLIPNENCYIGILASPPAGALVLHVAQLSTLVELTDFVINLNASETGNVVPTPKLKSKFETSIPGTVTGTFTSEMYRDSVAADDDAWVALPKDALLWFVIARFKAGTPILADKVEIWHVRVSSRTPSAMASNTAQTFTLTCSLPEVPAIDVAVAS